MSLKLISLASIVSAVPLKHLKSASTKWWVKLCTSAIINWQENKNERFPGRKPVIYLIYCSTD